MVIVIIHEGLSLIKFKKPSADVTPAEVLFHEFKKKKSEQLYT